MLFGADYYPEHWDRADWKKHARLMREANFNAVRIAEFAWCRLEPEEGVFDFSWLDEAIDILAGEGVRVILGTPTAAPPKWLVNKYDILMRDKYGRARGYGSRRECCSNNTVYIERSKIIVEKVAEHYASNSNVIAWQIDNEFGCHDSTVCYCDSCKAAFSKWLSKKYSNVDELNKRYGTVFWSQEYADFDDVIIPAYTSCEATYGNRLAHNPSLDMDYKRFSSDSWVAYQQMQIDIIRKYSSVPITHNLMGHFSNIDYYKLGKNLDIVSWDNYIDNQWNHSSYESVSMAHELMRGIKDKNFWVMEEQAGPCGWDMFGATPRPGEIRLWTYQAIAHGAEGIVYFRFKSAPFGMEQYWLGVVDHDGIPRRRYFEIQKTGAELKKLSELFVGSEPVRDVLLVKSYEDVWSHKIKSHVKGFDYRDLLYAYYRANLHLGTSICCGSKDMISSEYKIVYMPACAIITAEDRDVLSKYVSEGGTLVLTYRSGIKDTDNNMVTQTLPGYLRELSGITIEEFDASPIEVKLSGGFGKSSLWRDIISADTAKTVAEYESEYYAGTAAITVNTYGKGHVWYIACDLEEEALECLVKTISDEANAEYMTYPLGTEAVKKKKDGREYLMLLNYTAEEQNMNIGGRSVLNDRQFDGMLGAYGVEVLEL